MSFSVATKTSPPDTRGSPYSEPSRAGEVQAGEDTSTEVTEGATPLPAPSPW